MPRQITLTLPDGYEDATHVVLVSPSDLPDARLAAKQRGVSVLKIEGDETVEVEEVGVGGLNEGLLYAARIIRNGPTPPPAQEG